jgi:hypothetical protein
LTGGLAQAEENLLCKYKALSSNSSLTPLQKKLSTKEMLGLFVASISSVPCDNLSSISLIEAEAHIISSTKVRGE